MEVLEILMQKQEKMIKIYQVLKDIFIKKNMDERINRLILFIYLNDFDKYLILKIRKVKRALHSFNANKKNWQLPIFA